MPAAKGLEGHVRDATWRARLARHRELLETSPPPPWPQLAAIQAAYRATSHELERRAIAVEFERAVRTLAEDDDERAERERAEQELEELLDAPPEEISLDELAAQLDRSARATRACDLRRRGMSYAAIGEQVEMNGSKVRREIAWLERRLAPARAAR